MKKIFTAILTLLSLNVHAIDFGCVTEYPTTTFIAQTVDDYVQIQLIHHNGVKYAPVWSNLITINDISTIAEHANRLANLGDHLKFAMPADKCQLNGVQLYCFGFQPSVTINGHEVSLWAAYTSEQTDSSHAGDFSYITTTLALDIDGKTHFVPMKYGSHECFNGFKKQAALKKILK